MTALPTSLHSRPPSVRRLIVQGAAVSLVAAVIVGAALGPHRLGSAMAQLGSLHLHGPDLALLAAAPAAVKIHLTAVLIALGVGIVLLAGVKGSTLHRTLGWAWVSAMFTGAVSSLFIRMVNHGHLSFIHLLSGWTIVALPMGLAFARTHRVKLHARMMTGLFTGGLILAGLLAFMPGRLMWQMVFG
jgi:uncharacterized membrane protein